MTNIVRPRIAPLSNCLSFAYVSSGSVQLFVGPASCFVGVHTKVHCSTRATSFGLDRCRYERGTFFSFSSIRTFCLSDSAIRKSFSRSEPSHQKMFSGCVSVAISCTQSTTALLEGFASPIPFGGNMAGARFFIYGTAQFTHESVPVEATALRSALITLQRIARYNTGGIWDAESVVSLAQGHCEA